MCLIADLSHLPLTESSGQINKIDHPVVIEIAKVTGGIAFEQFSVSKFFQPGINNFKLFNNCAQQILLYAILKENEIKFALKMYPAIFYC